MYMLVAFLALLAFLGGTGGKSAKNVECAKGGVERTKTTPIQTQARQNQNTKYKF